jgi:hypothetical protein
VLAVTALGIGFLAGMVAGAIIQREGYLTQVADKQILIFTEI